MRCFVLSMRGGAQQTSITDRISVVREVIGVARGMPCDILRELTMDFSNIAELAAAVGADAVAALAEAGWELPVQVCASGAEGCVTLLRFEVDGRPPRVLAAHDEDEGPTWPVVLVFTNRARRVAMVIVEGGVVGHIEILR